MKTASLTTQSWSAFPRCDPSLPMPSLILHPTHCHHNLQRTQTVSPNHSFLNSLLSPIFLDKSQEQDFKSKQTVVSNSNRPSKCSQFHASLINFICKKNRSLSKYVDLICQKVSAILFLSTDKNVDVSVFTNIWEAI